MSHPRATTAAALRAASAQHGLDFPQVVAAYAATRRRLRTRTRPVPAGAWAQWVEQLSEQLLLHPDLDASTAVAVIDNLTARPAVDDPLTFAALRLLIREDAQRAARAIRRQLASTAALRGVTYDQVAARYTDLRHQHRHNPRAMPAPPALWRAGFTRCDPMSRRVPTDPATLYAFHRLHHDPDVLPAPHLPYAAVDLETAGPDGPDGFLPDNGAIIEVGITHHDPDGTHTATYDQLVRPPANADPAAGGYGTGASHVHGISWNDVAHAPHWEHVTPATAAHLTGRILIAHNLRYERTWLTHHLPGFDTRTQAIDTLSLIRQHRPDLDTHTLSNTCAALGVPYTDGHRAAHDALACARVLFRLRHDAHTAWTTSPSHAHLPQPAPVVLACTSTRLFVVDHDDPWATPATAGAAPPERALVTV